MKLEFESIAELKTMINALGYVLPAKDMPEKPAPKAKAKAKPKAEVKPKVEPKPEPTYLPEDKPEPTPTATREELMAYIQTNCADNVQPLLDMLETVGHARVSLIPDEKIGEAFTILKGE